MVSTLVVDVNTFWPCLLTRSGQFTFREVTFQPYIRRRSEKSTGQRPTSLTLSYAAKLTNLILIDMCAGCPDSSGQGSCECYCNVGTEGEGGFEQVRQPGGQERRHWLGNTVRPGRFSAGSLHQGCCANLLWSRVSGTACRGRKTGRQVCRERGGNWPGVNNIAPLTYLFVYSVFIFTRMWCLLYNCTVGAET